MDTENAESNDLVPFKNLFNEWFVRDTSRKIRAVQRAKAQRGERLGTRVPYGYKKDGSKVCTAHYNCECILNEIVLEDIRPSMQKRSAELNSVFKRLYEDSVLGASRQASSGRSLSAILPSRNS